MADGGRAQPHQRPQWKYPLTTTTTTTPTSATARSKRAPSLTTFRLKQGRPGRRFSGRLFRFNQYQACHGIHCGNPRLTRSGFARYIFLSKQMTAYIVTQQSTKPINLATASIFTMLLSVTRILVSIFSLIWLSMLLFLLVGFTRCILEIVNFSLSF